MTTSTSSSLTRFVRTLSLAAVVIATLWVTGLPASAQSSRFSRYDADTEFGPSPDAYLGTSRGYQPNTHGNFGTASTRKRTPELAPRIPWNDDVISRSSPRGRSFPVDESLEDLSAPWNTRTVPRTRPIDLEDLPLPTRRTVPVTKPAEPSLTEKVQQRYADPKVVRILQQLQGSSGEALYAEVSQYIDQRHIQPTSYQQRVEAALQHLMVAVETSSFQQALGIRPDTQTVRGLQRNLQAMASQVQAQNVNQAIGVMRQAGQMTSQALRVNPSSVSLAFIDGALSTLDKFSMFVAPEKSGETSAGLAENMVGIGVEIEAHPQGLKILKALAGGPAAAATLKRGDIITAVDGRSVAGLSLSGAVDLIAGPSGSPIKLDLRRDNMVGDVTLVRRPFEVHSVSEVRMEASTVGYIKLDQFSQSSAKELDKALWSLHNQGMQSLILDLRGNPGGLLTTAIEISDRFLPGGTIVSTRGRTQNDNSRETAQKANTWRTPLVVLVDHNSASASEIFAAAIQENGRGLVVGETSYGKGTVQTLFPLRSVPSALRLTTAKFYSPDGREMAGAGVTPDIKVTGMTTGNDTNDAGLATAVKAATSAKVFDMAEQAARLGRSAMRVIRVAI